MSVFVHSWFRSGSTWLWAKFRGSPGHLALYEPLNEELPLWTVEKLLSGPTIAFHGDNHPNNDRPYNFEYLELVQGNKLGFRQEFSYEEYFLAPEAAAENLLIYLKNLENFSRSKDLEPALCFCRSQMRSHWMKEHFPGVHIAQIRNPIDQWISFGKHEYFKRTTLITAFCLQKRWPNAFTHVFEFEHVSRSWRAGAPAKISDDACFCVFLTLWALSTIQAISVCDVVLDLDQISTNRDVRNLVNARFKQLELELDLSDCRAPNHANPEVLARYEQLVERVIAAMKDQIASPMIAPYSGLSSDVVSMLSSYSADVILGLTQGKGD